MSNTRTSIFSLLFEERHPKSEKIPPVINQATQPVAEREGPPIKGGATSGTLSFSRFRSRPSDHCDEMMIAERRAIRGEDENGVCMRDLNADRAGMDVHLSSPAPDSVDRGYHKIWRPVKGSRRTPPFWGSVGGDRSVGKMKGKLVYRPAGLSHINDNGEINP